MLTILFIILTLVLIVDLIKFSFKFAYGLLKVVFWIGMVIFIPAIFITLIGSGILVALPLLIFGAIVCGLCRALISA